jgi:CheY-like chemotaxis protein
VKTAPKILIVDDSEGVRLVIRYQVRSLGYDAVEAGGGLQAVEVGRSELPDLILLDVSMPLVDGLETARMLRGIKETSGIPIVALTAYDQSDLREHMLAAGCQDYAVKPLDIEGLRALITRNLAGGAPTP